MGKDYFADPTRQALEAALVADPDDLAAHMAYADRLVEQGDPRGEFVRVQLLLEGAEGSERDRLARREAELLRRHRREWLGDLAAPFLGRDDIRFRFRRGWLDEVEVGTMRADLSARLAHAPEIRLLRRLAVVNPDAPELDPAEAYRTHVLAGVAWFEEDEDAALVPLLDSPHLGNVRDFQLGDMNHERCDVGDGPVAGLVEKMPRLEELRLFLWRFEELERVFAMALPRLRVLHVGGVFGYPVAALARNASLRSLEELFLQPASPGGHSKLLPDECAELVRSPHLPALRCLGIRFLMVGDAFCEAAAESGILGRLQSLDLQYSEITDAGAAALAASPDLPLLGQLNLAGNRLTEEGINPLRATGVNLLWEPQTPPAEEFPAEEGSDGDGDS